MIFDLPVLLLNTILLRPYVFTFLAAFLLAGRMLLGWRRTSLFLLISWMTAFVCEFASTRVGVPFGDYYYTGSTVGQELYIANVPFMDSLSFTFLLFGSYCVALVFVLPSTNGPREHRLSLIFDPVVRTSPAVLGLTALFHTFIDVVIDPVALRGDRWFLGSIYGYPRPGLYFGIPLANFAGWTTVAVIALTVYFAVDRRLPPRGGDHRCSTPMKGLLFGCALYYAALIFSLGVTFWIGEAFLGMVGVMLYIPPTVLLVLRLLNRLPAPAA